MNLLQWNPCVELKGISSRVRSCIQEIPIPLLKKPQEIDYTGLNAALRRYEQDHISNNQDLDSLHDEK